MIVTAAGSYPRISDEPRGQALRRALAQQDEGRIDQAGVRQVQDAVVKTVIAEQVEAGLDLVTDGLIRWDDALTYIVRGLGGFTTEGLVRYLDTNTFYREPVARERVQWRGPITVADWQYASGVSPKPVKAVLTGPYTLGRLSRSTAHANRDDLVFDLARALRQEVRALHDAGAPLVQIDEPVITGNSGDWAIFREAMAELSREARGRLALNANFGSAAKLPDFFGLPFHVFGLDLIQGPDNWTVLERAPADREVVLGIVDAREVRLEEPSAIAATLERAAQFVSPDRMHVSPNCGLEFLPRETARAKLRRTVEGARLFSGVPSR
jgi:5-methyltetrahydropteroyltriglutamate--homocysteine methyltransferase